VRRDEKLNADKTGRSQAAWSCGRSQKQRAVLIRLGHEAAHGADCRTRLRAPVPSKAARPRRAHPTSWAERHAAATCFDFDWLCQHNAASGVATQVHAGGAGVQLALASGRNPGRTDAITLDARASAQRSRTGEVHQKKARAEPGLKSEEKHMETLACRFDARPRHGTVLR